MNPLRLSLVNWLGVISGYGKNSVSLDLTKVAAGALLVALYGPNGSGKTTLMDQLQPYRLLPSRSSGTTPSTCSLYDHIPIGVDASKTLDWEHDGKLYRTVLKLRQTAKTKRTEAYLFTVDDNDVATPYRNQDGLVSDGKADTYDRLVESILGKPEVFFSTTFASQGKKPISTMTATEIKTLFANMLNLSDLNALAAKASQVVKEIRPHVAALQEQRTRLQSQMLQAESLSQQCAMKTAESLGLKARATELQANMVTAQSELAVREAALANQQSIAAQHAAVDQRLASCQSLSREAMDALARSQSTLRLALTNTVQAKRDVLDKARLRVVEVGRLCESNANLLKLGRAVNEAEAERQVNRTRAQELIQVMASTQNSAESLAQMEKRLTEMREALLGDMSSYQAQGVVLQRASEALAFLGGVPCAGTDLAGRCQLLSDARERSSKIPEIKVNVAALRDKIDASKAAGVSHADKLKLMRAETDRFNDAKQQLAQLDARLAVLDALLSRKAEVMAAAKAEADLEELRSQAGQEVVNAEAARAESQSALDQFGISVQRETESLIEKGQRDMQVILAEKLALPELLTPQGVEASKSNVERIKREIQANTLRIDETDQALAGLRASFESARKAAQQDSELAVKIDAMGEEASNWVLLTRALGTDGIVAMCIDDAGPGIAAQANHLLSLCFDGRFQIRLVTQSSTASGTQREDFDVIVEDTHRGESKTLELMSGGERVWVNECLILGLTLYMAQVNGLSGSCLFADESDGPLDSVRKRQFMEMQRHIMESGLFSRKFIITQTPELVAMCDAVIDVTTL